MSPQSFYPCEGPQCFPRVSGGEPWTIDNPQSSSRFPRVSGDEPDTLWLGPAGTEFSPRERG